GLSKSPPPKPALPRKVPAECLTTQVASPGSGGQIGVVNTRRQFLIQAPLGLLGVAAACRGEPKTTAASQTSATPGAPPAFGTLPEVGPLVSPATFREAEKLMQVTLSDTER